MSCVPRPRIAAFTSVVLLILAGCPAPVPGTPDVHDGGRDAGSMADASDANDASDARMDTRPQDVTGPVDAALDATADTPADSAIRCNSSTQCHCGQRCVSGLCVISDCSDEVCSDSARGRVCTCTNGILDIDGRTGPQYPAQDVLYRRRPFTAADDGTDLVVRNLRVHDAVNMKGVHITRCEMANNWRYRRVTMQCVEVFNVNRDAVGMAAGLHLDYIKYDGCGDGKPGDVTLEDVYVHDGNVYTLFSDARIGTLTLRRVRHENTDGAFQIGTLTNPADPMWGRIDFIVVENSPGLRTALMGTKIGLVRVIESPGFLGGNNTAARVVYDRPSCPARTLESNECCTSATSTCGL